FLTTLSVDAAAISVASIFTASPRIDERKDAMRLHAAGVDCHESRGACRGADGAAPFKGTMTILVRVHRVLAAVQLLGPMQR
ncbi:MAG: hypothetical protein ACJ8KO_13100, partial [Sulfurifustaceae bacterium]